LFFFCQARYCATTKKAMIRFRISGERPVCLLPRLWAAAPQMIRDATGGLVWAMIRAEPQVGGARRAIRPAGGRTRPNIDFLSFAGGQPLNDAGAVISFR
jgi:hypothetical protein